MDNKNARKELHKDKLQGEIIRAIKTTMIGALSKIEEKLGYLWAFQENRELTNDEQYFLDLYSELRKDILDNGNNQIKKTKALVDTYEVEYIGYTLHLVAPVRRKE